MATRADGPSIRRKREARGLNGAQLAEMSGISRYYLSRLERGERHGSPAVRLRLALALNVPLADITYDDAEPVTQVA